MVESDKTRLISKKAVSSRSHERVHAKEKAFKCDCCGQQFSRKNHFNQHLKIHTGEKPFKCDYCELKFIQHN